MPMVAFGDKFIFFAHVPKAGGTSVEHYLASRFGSLQLADYDWNNLGLDRRSLVCSPQHIIGKDIDRMFGGDFFLLRFATVRDPITRIVSEYRYQDMWHSVQTGWRRRFARLGFSVWMAMALSATRRDPAFFDHHLRPQTDFLPKQTAVFRLEDGLEPISAYLDAALGSQCNVATFPHKLKGDGKRAAKLSRKDVAMIAAFYARDYRRLDYRKPNPKDYPVDWRTPLLHGIGRLLAPFACHLYRTGRM